MRGKRSERKQQRVLAKMNWLDRQGSASFPGGKGYGRQRVGAEVCTLARERKAWHIHQ